MSLVSANRDSLKTETMENIFDRITEYNNDTNKTDKLRPLIRDILTNTDDSSLYIVLISQKPINKTDDFRNQYQNDIITVLDNMDKTHPENNDTYVKKIITKDKKESINFVENEFKRMNILFNEIFIDKTNKCAYKLFLEFLKIYKINNQTNIQMSTQAPPKTNNNTANNANNAKGGGKNKKTRSKKTTKKTAKKTVKKTAIAKRSINKITLPI
jgi:hypothetical protein